MKPDEIYNPASGPRDTINPFLLAKWAFLTWLAAGMPWDTKDPADQGAKLLEAILSKVKFNVNLHGKD